MTVKYLQEISATLNENTFKFSRQGSQNSFHSLGINNEGQCQTLKIHFILKNQQVSADLTIIENTK